MIRLPYCTRRQHNASIWKIPLKMWETSSAFAMAKGASALFGLHQGSDFLQMMTWEASCPTSSFYRLGLIFPGAHQLGWMQPLKCWDTPPGNWHIICPFTAAGDPGTNIRMSIRRRPCPVASSAFGARVSGLPGASGSEIPQSWKFPHWETNPTNHPCCTQAREPGESCSADPPQANLFQGNARQLVLSCLCGRLQGGFGANHDPKNPARNEKGMYSGMCTTIAATAQRGTQPARRAGVFLAARPVSGACLGPANVPVWTRAVRPREPDKVAAKAEVYSDGLPPKWWFSF